MEGGFLFFGGCGGGRPRNWDAMHFENLDFVIFRVSHTEKLKSHSVQ